MQISTYLPANFDKNSYNKKSDRDNNEDEENDRATPLEGVVTVTARVSVGPGPAACLLRGSRRD